MCRHHDQTCTLFQSPIKHEMCRLHSLIQGPTSSLCNIVPLVKIQKSIWADLVWTDEMCVTDIKLSATSSWTFYIVMMTQSRLCGFYFYLTRIKIKQPPKFRSYILHICFPANAQCAAFSGLQSEILGELHFNFRSKLSHT